MMKPSVVCPAAVTPPAAGYCNTEVVSEAQCNSGSGASHTGSCNVPGGSFCCHDHTYITPHFPDPYYAYATYTYSQDVTLGSVLIEQHSNGTFQCAKRGA
jgi:hypothetical protein